MVVSKTFLTAIMAVCLLASASATCFNKCRFFFCNGKHVIRVGKPDRPLTGPICRKGKNIGVVGSTFEAKLVKDRLSIPISQYHPEGLEQQFSPSFFKTYTIPFKRYHPHRFIYRSGVGHEVPQQNQASFLDNKCFVLPIAAYQVLDEKGNVIDNIHPRNDPYRECIAFTTVLG